MRPRRRAPTAVAPFRDRRASRRPPAKAAAPSAKRSASSPMGLPPGLGLPSLQRLREELLHFLPAEAVGGSFVDGLLEAAEDVLPRGDPRGLGGAGGEDAGAGA